MACVKPGPCPGVYLLNMGGKDWLATLPRDGAAVYGERVVDGHRVWDPNRSKLAVFMLNREERQDIGLRQSSKVLYLGAATGTTVSHVSDILEGGIVYAVEFSPRAMRDLLRLAESRENIVPILADAARPELYSDIVEPVDVIYQDVAQRNQAEIAARNAARYLLPGGTLIFMMKTRSIDVTSSPKDVLQNEVEGLKGLDVTEVLDLQPFHQDHWAVLAKKPKRE